MSVSSLALFSSWRDYYGEWNALVEPQMAPLEQSSCHAPRYALLPDISHQTVPPSGKIEYNFHLPVGSIIWGMFVPNPTDDFAMQLTDISLGHQFFQEPVFASMLFTPGAIQTALYPAATLFASPHPVVGDGLFSFEAWANPASTVVLLLGVAEVTDCPVR
jgi:hypothetical protein